MRGGKGLEGRGVEEFIIWKKGGGGRGGRGDGNPT